LNTQSLEAVLTASHRELTARLSAIEDLLQQRCQAPGKMPELSSRKGIVGRHAGRVLSTARQKLLVNLVRGMPIPDTGITHLGSWSDDVQAQAPGLDSSQDLGLLKRELIRRGLGSLGKELVKLCARAASAKL